MANAKISALPSATVPLAGTEVLPVVQGGTTDKVTAADLLRQNGQTVTTSNPVLSLAQTWNAGGVTFTGLKFNATDTASAAASLLLDLQVGGTSQFSVTKAGRLDMLGLIAAGGNIVSSANVQAGASSSILWSSRTLLSAPADGYLGISTNAGASYGYFAALGANSLAQVNSTNAQTFSIYKTRTDASNNERLEIGSTGYGTSAMGVLARAGGSGDGTVPLVVGTFGAANLGLVTNNTLRWQVAASTGHFLAGADNTYDIGASGATRPRNVYVGTDVRAGNNVLAGVGWYLGWNGRTLMTSPSDGFLQITDNAGTGVGGIRIGPSSASFPLIKRNGAEVQFRLGDDSGFTKVQGQLKTHANAVAETPTATHTLTLYDAAGTAYRVLCVV